MPDRPTIEGRDRTADLERLADMAVSRLSDPTGTHYLETWTDPDDDLDDVDRGLVGWSQYVVSLQDELPDFIRREWALRKGSG